MTGQAFSMIQGLKGYQFFGFFISIPSIPFVSVRSRIFLNVENARCLLDILDANCVRPRAGYFKVTRIGYALPVTSAPRALRVVYTFLLLEKFYTQESTDVVGPFGRSSRVIKL